MTFSLETPAIAQQNQQPSTRVDVGIDSVLKREWLARIQLGYEYRRGKTVLVDASHMGPLRVQRPFYPEADGTCHSYLLHPPGGMAVGDQLAICVSCSSATSALITTPSAGKMYGVQGVAGGNSMPQQQQVRIDVQEGASCEWLPQETIVFNAANARINTTIKLQSGACFIGWDIVRLGRAASGETFASGQCQQKLLLYVDDELVFVESTPILADAELIACKGGLDNRNTLATMLATVDLNRDQVDELYQLLADVKTRDVRDNPEAAGLWGLSQKESLFIVRYLGNSILECREGLTLIWQYLRPIVLGKQAVLPRIWNT